MLPMRFLMKAKVKMLARLNADGFPYTPVEFRRNQIDFPIVTEYGKFEKDQVMGFYARLQNNGVIPGKPLGKRLTHPLGKDSITAYMLFQQIDQDFERIERGLVPVNVA